MRNIGEQKKINTAKFPNGTETRLLLNEMRIFVNANSRAENFVRVTKL